MNSISAILNKHQSGVARIRVADEDLVMSPQELAEYIRKGDREENRWENLISNKTIDDVDEELLKKYTNQAHDVGRIAIEYTDKKTVLNQLELSEGKGTDLVPIDVHTPMWLWSRGKFSVEI